MIDYTIPSDNQFDALLLNARKKWLRLICFGYIMFLVLFLPAIISHKSFDNVCSVVWISIFYVYLILKCIYMIFFEIKNNKKDLHCYINFCEYVLFFTGVVLIFTVDHKKENSLESLIFVIVLIWSLPAIIFVLLLIIAMAFECCGYNIRLKDLFLNIFEFEIVILQYIVVQVIVHGSQHGYEPLPDKLSPEHKSLNEA